VNKVTVTLKNKLKKCEPDDHVIRLSFAKNMATGWGCHPVVISKTKWEPDETHPVVILPDWKNSLFAIDSLPNTKSTTL